MGRRYTQMDADLGIRKNYLGVFEFIWGSILPGFLVDGFDFGRVFDRPDIILYGRAF